MRKILYLLFIIVLPLISSAQSEDCGNSIDDDGDGLVDCMDPDCSGGTVPTGALFNTASNGAGGTLPGGSDDTNWQFSTGSILGPYSPAKVMTAYPGSYYPSPWPDCDWISHNVTGTHSVNTDYYYKINFYLPCYTSCGASYADSATFCLYMDFFVDNSVDEVYVNGIAQSGWIAGVPASSPYSHVGFSATGGLSLSLCQDWQPGLNELIIKVSSGPGYSAFLAQNSTTAPVITGDATILSPFNNYTACVTSDTIQYQAASVGGIWSATCGSCIDSITGVFDPAIAGIGTYDIIYTVTTPCFASDTVTINVVTLPDASIFTDTLFCSDNPPVNLTAATSGGTWSGTGITNSLAGTFDPSLVSAGNTTIVYTLSGACYDSDTITLFVNQINLTGSFLNESCFQSQDGSITSSATELGLAGFTTTFTLAGPVSGTNGTGDFGSLPTGSYTLWASSTSGCDDTLTFTITSPAEVNASFTADSTSGFPPLDVNFVNTSTGATSYYWDFGNGSDSIGLNASTIYDNSGTYIVTLYAYNGACVDSFSLAIEVTLPSALIVYNIFTPNGDQVNDVFLTTNKNLDVYEITIYNRWGLIVFHSTDPQSGWNGKAQNGNAYSDGTYYYTVNAIGLDGKIYDLHGALTMVRH